MSALSKYFTLKSALYWHTLFFILAMLQSVPLLGISWLVINIFVFISLTRAVYGPSENKRKYDAIAWYFYTLSIFADSLSLCIFGQYMVNGAHAIFALVMAVFMLLPKPLFSYSVLKSLQNDGFDYKRGFDTMPEPDIESQFKYKPPNRFINIVTEAEETYQGSNSNVEELKYELPQPENSVVNLVKFNGQYVYDVSPKVQSVKPSKMKDLVYGACFLASGGGGPLKIGLKFAEEIKDADVKLIKPGSIERNNSAVIVALLGSPESCKTQGRTAPINATNEMIQWAKTQSSTLSVVYPGEIGALNAIIPFYVAAKLGLNVMDADISGRSVPYISNTVLAVNKVPCCPANMATDDGNTGDEDAKSNDDQKYLVKSWDDTKMTPDHLNDAIGDQMLNKWKLAEDKRVVGINIWYIKDPNNKQFFNLVNKFTLDTSIKLGKVFTDDSIVGQAKMGSIQKILYAADGQEKEMHDLFSGYLSFWRTIPTQAIDCNKIIFTNKDSNKQFVVYGLNENLMAYDLASKQLAAMAPDGITFLDKDYMPLDVTSIRDDQGNKDKIFYIQGIECWNNMGKGTPYCDEMLKTVQQCQKKVEELFKDKWPEITKYTPIADLQRS